MNSSDLWRMAETAIHVLGAGVAAWVAIRIELRWLRADVTAHSRTLDKHDERIRQLEVK